MRIPYPWGKKIMLEYNQEYRYSIDTNTLGYRIRFAWNRINLLCTKIKDKRLMKMQNRELCCSKLEEPPRFGCSNKTYKYRKSSKRRNSLKPIKNIKK